MSTDSEQTSKPDAPQTLHDLNLAVEELDVVIKKTLPNLRFFDFLYEILGMRDLNDIHHDLCRFIEGPRKSKLILMPRNSFKSTICTVGYSIFRLLKDPNLRILIYSDASTKAEGFLSSIKAHLEGNAAGSTFGKIYDWVPVDKKKKWNENQVVIRDRTAAYPEPSIDTGGIETSKVGMHYDLIIFDDIVSDKNVTTKEQMDKVAECYKRSLSLLKPGGDILMVGTRWSFGDLYGRLLAENELGVFDVFLKAAIEDGKLLFDNVGSNSLTQEFLDNQRKQQGSYNFSCLYQNSPTDPETAVFKTGDFSFYGDIKPDDLYITCACDPAGEGDDFTGITIVGTDNKMDMHILEVVNKHLQPSDILNELFRLNTKYKFKMLGLETNFFRGMLKKSLQERRDKESREDMRFNSFGIHEFIASAKRGEGKHNRIMALQPYHERGAIKFPGKKVELLEGAFSELAFQMIQFPHSAHDDCLDSLAYHLELVRKGGMAKKAAVPKNTPAYLEQKMYEQDLRRNSFLPRRLRRNIPAPSFI